MAVASIAAALCAGCPSSPPPGGDVPSETYREDTTLESLTIASGDLHSVENNAVVTVTGDATIDGRIIAGNSRITLRVEGALIINGRIETGGDAPSDESLDQPLATQSVGVTLIVGEGAVTFGPTASISTRGHVVVTDDDSVLSETPRSLYDEVEEVGGDDLATLVPLPPDNSAFDDGGAPKLLDKLPVLQQGAGAPITIGGVWPPAGAAPIPGDRPVVIFRFHGSRPLNLDGWTVNGPAAPPGENADQTENPSESATGSNGKNGMRLNIRNNGGPINIVNNVVLNLANGGDGGRASAACGSATGGAGGLSGNFRMTASDGIDLSQGTLTINAGRGGHGGAAEVEPGAAGANGCPGDDGDGGEALGGPGGDNRKRLLARGNIVGIENVIIGALSGGNGGNATALTCDGGDGDPCCDGGKGGDAEATGGKGGDASLNVSGLPVTVGDVTGGNGGNAAATGADGGDGGDCKFLDGGNGGDGGNAEATGGAGGGATNTGGPASGGDGGTATATGGTGGDGGDSGFGVPGVGGAGGEAVAEGGEAGAGTTAGSAGADAATDGDPGTDGEEMDVVLYCIYIADFIGAIPGTIAPGEYTGSVTQVGSEATVGTITVEFLNVPLAQYQSGGNPVPHIGIGNGTLRIDVTSFELLNGTHGIIGGISVETLFGIGLSESSPLRLQALDANGELIGEGTFPEVPDNSQRPDEAEAVSTQVEVDESVALFDIVAPSGSFVTIIRVYLLDP